jgi:hypothetical protein
MPFRFAEMIFMMRLERKQGARITDRCSRLQRRQGQRKVCDAMHGRPWRLFAAAPQSMEKKAAPATENSPRNPDASQARVPDQGWYAERIG